MQKKINWMKRGIICLAFLMLLVPQMNVSAVSDNDTSDEANDDEIADAVNRLTTYYKNLKLVNEDELTADQLKKLEKICNDARNYIAGTDDITRAQVDIHVSETKALMDNYLTKCLGKRPQSTSDYLVVGNTYESPVAKPGEQVLVVLPIYNLGEENLTNLIVTPVLSNSVKEWPFEIDRTGYGEEVGDLPGSHNMEEATANHREVHYTMTTRKDVLTGYYKLDFNVVYERDGKPEKATLTTYIKAEGAPGSGMIDQDAEGSKTSTPRIVVTGFETDPKEIFAGSTFMLTIHVKNTSQRTAVSNVEFDLEAAKEGKDDNTLYASFLPTSGANSIYVSKIPMGGTADLAIEMTAKADLVQKPYAIDMTMKYEDEKYNPYENKTSLSIPVSQLSRIEASSAEVMPESIVTGDQANVSFNVYNTGKTVLYNVKVKFEDPSVTGGDCYVGKLDIGATGTVDAMLTGVTPSAGDGKIKTIISYENDAGKVTEVESSITLPVTEIMETEGTDMGMEEMGEASSGKAPLYIGLTILSGGILVGGILVFRHRAKKKKAAKELAEDLEALTFPEDEEKGE